MKAYEENILDKKKIVEKILILFPKDIMQSQPRLDKENIWLHCQQHN